MKDDYTNPGHVVPSIVSHIYVCMETFLLQITKKLSISHHMEWCTWVQVRHAPHHFSGHACNEGKVKLKMWSQGFTLFSSRGLIYSLLVWTLRGIVPEFTTVKALAYGQVFLLVPLTRFWFGFGFLPFSLLCFSSEAQFSSSLPLGEFSSLVFHLISSCTKPYHKHYQFGSSSLRFTESW